MPVIERSPMVIRKALLATVGWLSTRLMASSSSMPCALKLGLSKARPLTSLCIFGGFPKSTDIGISTGLLAKTSSDSSSLSSLVDLPTTA